MRYEEVHGLKVPKIGFGTWGIGGKSAADRSKDTPALEALRSALSLGYRHFDTAEMYAAGHCEELLGQAIRESRIRRDDLFVSSKVKPEHLAYADVLTSCHRSLARLGMDYIDLYLIHWPSSGIPLADTFRALNELVRDGRVRQIGVSNFPLRLLKESLRLSAAPILTDQVPFSLHDRSYARNGVLRFCQENGIVVTAYTPFGEDGIAAEKRLSSIAKAHRATAHQVALAWLILQPHVITIPMSREPGHQAENLAAAEIELSPEEVAQLN